MASTPPSSSSGPGIAPTVESLLVAHHADAAKRAARELLGTLVQPGQYVGEVYSIGYESALVQIHDSHRQKVGGIPGLAFLIATRVVPDADVDFAKEDSSVLLLRVMDAAPLPNHSEAERIRSETAQRVTGEDGMFWDHAEVMDSATANVLSFAGVKCRVIGTFYLEPDPTPGARVPLRLCFGSDLSNYYPNRGLKVYKPNGDALRRIVNFRDSRWVSGAAVTVGVVRYASTNRAFQGVADVPVEIVPEDLLGQKTALFGMTRMGKSNTTKIILRSVFDLRFGTSPRRIGQIVFDVNGEYANENVQDRGALKSIWKRPDSAGDRADVVTYGTRPHPSDPDRKLMLINFYDEGSLQQGKEIVDSALEEQRSIYVTNFRQVSFADPPSQQLRGPYARFRRRVLAYRALLAKAGFPVPRTQRPDVNGLFGADLLAAMRSSQGKNRANYSAAAELLGRQGGPSWEQLATALEYLDGFISDSDSGYDTFNQTYMQRPNGSGDPWAEEDLKKILRMFGYANGARLIAAAKPMHAPSVGVDPAVEIYEDLKNGKLVIIDQSGGDATVNRSSAERIMRHIFLTNQGQFRDGAQPPNILVYVEEAHNILPAGNDLDLADIWVRTAKEGAKYHVGLVYATQEVSSIQKNILKNTANWFIGHLNNTDETKELVKYYDFEDFEASIRRAQDRGFLRVKTLSNLFVVPAQIAKFEVAT